MNARNDKNQQYFAAEHEGLAREREQFRKETDAFRALLDAADEATDDGDVRQTWRRAGRLAPGRAAA